jgi:hypothetical protein
MGRSDAPQRRPRRAVWVFPEAVRRHKARQAASPSPLPGYLCELCQDAPAVQWQPTPEGREIGVCAACAAGTHDEEPPEAYVWPN